jgi:hypothetical protein
VLLRIRPLLLLAVPTTADDTRLLEATPETEVERPWYPRPARPQR